MACSGKGAPERVTEGVLVAHGKNMSLVIFILVKSIKFNNSINVYNFKLLSVK